LEAWLGLSEITLARIKESEGQAICLNPSACRRRVLKKGLGRADGGLRVATGPRRFRPTLPRPGRKTRRPKPHGRRSETLGSGAAAVNQEFRRFAFAQGYKLNECVRPFDAFQP